jgi:hypothetical protein
MDGQTNSQLWDAMLVSATEATLAHASSWTDLLDKHARSLPEDRPPSGHDGDDGCYDHSYAEHELKAMRRELAALAAVRFMQVATNLGTTYRLAETTSEARWHATDWVEELRRERTVDTLTAAALVHGMILRGELVQT